MNYRTVATLFVGLALIGCKGDGDTDETDTDDTNTCVITAADQFPSDGATNVYYRTTLEWTFSEEDPSATVALSAGGTDVSGSTNWFGTVLVFTPDSPLDPSVTYDVTLSYCDGANNPASSFTTSAVGTAVPEVDTVGSTYVLELGEGRFVEPQGVGPLLQDQLEVDILIGVIGADATNIQLMGALAEDGSSPPTQDDCQPSIDFPEASFSENPYFEVGPQTTTIAVQGIEIVVDDLFVSGAFAPDASSISGAVLAGSIDTRPLVTLVDPDATDENTVCDLVGALGIPCEPCGGGGDFCLSLLVDSLAAVEVPGETLIPILETDIPDPCP